ncbi:MAG TPA: adenylate/guanylate cyclase domain-containing protein [bacterium]|nr:adenylate/guanylate cyclase domain-containing protein [bacterium]
MVDRVFEIISAGMFISVVAVAVPTALSSLFYAKRETETIRGDQEIRELFFREINSETVKILLGFSLFVLALVLFLRINDAQRYLEVPILRMSRDLQLAVSAATAVAMVFPAVRARARILACVFCYAMNAVVLLAAIGMEFSPSASVAMIIPSMLVLFLFPAPSGAMMALCGSIWLTNYAVLEFLYGVEYRSVLAALMMNPTIFFFICIFVGALSYHLKQREIINRVGLAREKEKSESLLRNILPEDIVKEFKEYGTIRARRYEEATILFADIVGFTAVAENVDPATLVSWLDEIFKKFDEVSEKHGLEKLKTIGDCYMTVCGVPVKDERHALKSVRAAFDMLDAVREFRPKGSSGDSPIFKMRVGVHSGPVVAGVIGTKKYSYDVWGDNVNIASRLEAAGEAGRVNVSRKTSEAIAPEFKCVTRGLIDVRNRAPIEMFWVDKPQ